MKIKKGYRRSWQRQPADPQPTPAKQVVVVEQRPAAPTKRLLWALGRCAVAIFYVLLSILSSIGATALVNQPTREMLWHLFN